jgi:hypothetical protein
MMTTCLIGFDIWSSYVDDDGGDPFGSYNQHDLIAQQKQL